MVLGLAIALATCGLMSASRAAETGPKHVRLLAIGAKDRDILGQFLLEAVLMSGLGGLIGVVAGVGGAKVVERVMAFPTAVELSSVLLAMFFAMAVGVFFGYSPARRAAMLNPIEALRYE